MSSEKSFEIKTYEFSANGFPNDVRILLSKLENIGAFSHGCFIAGGFPRKLAHCMGFLPVYIGELGPYFYKETTVQPVEKLRGFSDIKGFWTHRGDVDIFMPPGAEKNFNFSGHDWKKSVAGHAKNTAVSSRMFEDENLYRVEVQFVDDPRYQYKDIRQCFENFDLVNCRYALTKNGDTVTLHWDPQAMALDYEHTLRINKNTSPQLGARVTKYIGARGCENGLDEDSKKLLREWCLRVACDKWEKSEDNDIGSASTHAERSLKKIAALDLMQPKDLTLFLSKWTTSMNIDDVVGYGSRSIQVDWAEHMINLHNKCAQSEIC